MYDKLPEPIEKFVENLAQRLRNSRYKMMIKYILFDYNPFERKWLKKAIYVFVYAASLIVAFSLNKEAQFIRLILSMIAVSCLLFFFIDLEKYKRD